MFQYHKTNGETVQVTAHGDGTLTIKSTDRTGRGEALELWDAPNGDNIEREWQAMYDALMHLAGG